MSDGIASKDALPRGTVLRGYSIREVLGQGGFGIVYRARHIELGNVVAIKEYLPAELAVRVGSSVRPRSASYVDFYRDGLRRFRKEGQALVALHNQSGIVSCRDFFRRNNTAYLVMEFEAGMPLSHVLQERESEGRPFCEEDLMGVAVPLLEGLGHVHAAGMVHRDIKPSNLLLREANGEPVLIDFGAAKHDAATQTKSMAPRTPGYAAWEQIVPDGELGPWTDIYAIGVLLWRIVAGGAPSSERRYPVPVERRMDAVVRGDPEPMPTATELGRGRFNPEILAAIDYCLKLRHDERIQDCTELLGLLRLDGESQYGVAMRIYLRISGYDSRNRDSRSEESDYSEIRNSPLLAEVVEWLSLAAEKEHGAAQYELAFLHHHGIGARHDPSLARDLLHQSADSGYFKSQQAIAYIYGFAFIHSRYEYFLGLSEVGRACATYLLDRALVNHSYRIHPTRNDYENANLTRLAARWNRICYHRCDMDRTLGNPHAYDDVYDPQFRPTRGRYNELILTIPKRLADDIKSRVGDEDTFQAAFEAFRNPQPVEEAQYEIGRIYEIGVGETVPQDLLSAVFWYRRIAKPERSPFKVGDRWTTNQLEACMSADSRLRALARANIEMDRDYCWYARDYCWNMYNQGRIAPENVDDAFNWIEFGATLGNADAQYHLGWMYWNGKGIPCNHSESVNWFRAAARSGNPHAQNSLGVCYFFGRGVAQSYARSQAWFLLSAGSYAFSRPDLPYATFKNIPRKASLSHSEISSLLSCITKDNAMRHAIDWEDQSSRDCFLEAYNHLAMKKEKYPHKFEPPVRDERNIFRFNPTKKFFYACNGFSYSHSTSIDPNRCEIPENSMFSFRTHPWEFGCLRAVYNFAASRLIQFHLVKCNDLGVIQPEPWFLSVMSRLSECNYPMARFIQSICIVNERPYEAFSEVCLAADQNHRESQVILSLMYSMSEGVDSNSSLLERESSNLSMRRDWINARSRFGPNGYGRESLPVYLIRSINQYRSLYGRDNNAFVDLGIEPSQFDLDPWGMWGFDVSICCMFPNAWYELCPLFHSGQSSDSALDIMRSYAAWRVREYHFECDDHCGYCEPDFCRTVQHMRMLRKIRSAAFQGDSDAQFAFAAIYASGDGVTVDYALALDFLREAAMDGNGHACIVLGLLYEHGHGVAKDHQRSGFWYRRSQVGAGVQSGITSIGDQALIYNWGINVAIGESSANALDRCRYLYHQDEARTHCSWTTEEWRGWFESTLGCGLSQRWKTADYWRPSWDY